MSFMDGPQWDKDLASVPSLLAERTALATDNYAARTIPQLKGVEPSPLLSDFKKRLKQLDEQIRINEIVEQGKFLSELRKKRDKQLAKANGSSPWDSSRRASKAEARWLPLAALLEGVT